MLKNIVSLPCLKLINSNEPINWACSSVVLKEKPIWPFEDNFHFSTVYITNQTVR